jgi:ADP-ribose pyrophosphatase
MASHTSNTAGYVTVNDLGMPVPSMLRPWSTPWPGYGPVDITPPELRPAGLADSVAEGWAEPYATPADVPDWSARQARALVPFTFDAQGMPLNPAGRTGRAGRNLGAWGENQAADPIVIAGDGTNRRILLIRRADIGVWAIPGGMVEPGEYATKAAARELHEESGVDLTEHTPKVLSWGYVDDWRNTDNAWVCSTAVLYRLPAEVAATAGDDAADAGWFPLYNREILAATLAPIGGLYAAHRPMLTAALDYLLTH